MTDIVERLRFLGTGAPFRGAQMCEAADEIERMRAERRWNIEWDNSDLLICRGEHEKDEKCEYVRYKPAAMTDWIPVTERLPEEFIDCWITTEGGKAVMWAYCNDGSWYFDGDDTPIESLVLAWQPIHKPELYQP